MTRTTDGTVFVNDKLSKKNRDLFDRFETSYNSIDRHLRKVLKVGRDISFSRVVSEFEKKNRAFSNDADYLKMIKDLRNVLVHEKCKPIKYLAIPTVSVVERLESIYNKLIHPKLAIPTFQKMVDTLSHGDSLANVLKLIADKDFSQFPVYENGNFRGVLTESGITRWLAHYVLNELSLVELEDIPVKTVLEMEEKRSNFIFISRDISIDNIKENFSNRELLEVVLITESGKKTENLMGIVTRWDILKIQ
jgi:predicted transcriptional regulator